MTTCAPLASADPTSVGEYTLLGRLGAGGMGTVYLGRDRAGATVAVKLVHEHLAGDPRFVARFAAEAAAARRVAGFCTARVVHADVRGPRPFLVTEYVDGPTLEGVLAAGPLSASQVEALAVGVAAALTAIHAAGVVHRDLKPSNVMLSGFGPKVIDFGVASALHGTVVHTETGMVFGTPGWMAPEQLQGAVTAAGDVYVWGLLVARAGTTWRPTPQPRPAPPTTAQLAELPHPLADAVTAALYPDPARRPSARDLLLRLCGSAEPAPVRAATAVLSRPWDPRYTAVPPSHPAAQHAPAQPASPQHAPGRPKARPSKPPQPGQPSHASHPGHPGPQSNSSQPGHLGQAGSQGSSSRSGHLGHSSRSGHKGQQSHLGHTGQQGHPGYTSQPGQPGQRPGSAPGPLFPAPGPYPYGVAPVRRRRWYRRKRVLIPLVLLVLLILANPGDKPDQSLPPLTARDGILEFVVTDVACGTEAVGTPGLARKPQGQLCRVDLRVRNFGEATRRVDVRSQKLHDAKGREFSADDGAWVYLPESVPFFREEINPGNEISATLVFDIAADAEPATLEVHDSPLSGGASVEL